MGLQSISEILMIFSGAGVSHEMARYVGGQRQGCGY